MAPFSWVLKEGKAWATWVSDMLLTRIWNLELGSVTGVEWLRMVMVRDDIGGIADS